jgi:hypothetical protein
MVKHYQIVVNKLRGAKIAAVKAPGLEESRKSNA